MALNDDMCRPLDPGIHALSSVPSGPNAGAARRMRCTRCSMRGAPSGDPRGRPRLAVVDALTSTGRRDGPSGHSGPSLTITFDAAPWSFCDAITDLTRPSSFHSRRRRGTLDGLHPARGGPARFSSSRRPRSNSCDRGVAGRRPEGGLEPSSWPDQRHVPALGALDLIERYRSAMSASTVRRDPADLRRTGRIAPFDRSEQTRTSRRGLGGIECTTPDPGRAALRRRLLTSSTTSSERTRHSS